MEQLPVPKRIMDYLKTPNYYSENIEDPEEENKVENIANQVENIVQETTTNSELEINSVPAADNLYLSQSSLIA